jgi:radical SAM superfamily enzyme YgiQ (UPF0313 family)
MKPVHSSGRLRVVLISPKGPLYRHRGGIWKKSLRYQPLTLTTLAALVIPKDLPVDVRLIDEGIADVPDDLEADLVGLTVITGTARRAYELADRYRARGITVVLGGPHVTLVPDDAAARTRIPSSWVTRRTPGPSSFAMSGPARSNPRYRSGPGARHRRPPFPSPRPAAASSHFLTNNVFEATRGCVHACDFCVVPTAWGRKPYQKPVDEVIADIRQHGARKLIFVDLNLVAHRGYAVALFTALIPLRLQWYGLATVLLADDPSCSPFARAAAAAVC